MQINFVVNRKIVSFLWYCSVHLNASSPHYVPPLRIMVQVFLDQEIPVIESKTGSLDGWISACVCAMFVFQTWSPCKGIISPGPPDVHKQ